MTTNTANTANTAKHCQNSNRTLTAIPHLLGMAVTVPDAATRGVGQSPPPHTLLTVRLLKEWCVARRTHSKRCKP